MRASMTSGFGGSSNVVLRILAAAVVRKAW